MTNELSKERAIEALYTVRAYYASLTAGYPKGKDCRGIGDVMCSEIANSCLMAIKALEQTPPKGKWSRPSVIAMPYSFAYECPICRQWGNIQTFKPNYCPNCGADMRGEEEE